jgi:hypothetical protein
MTNYYILTKRKGGKNFTGAIPGKPGVSKSILIKTARVQIKKPFVFKIITESEFRRLIRMKRKKQLLSKRRRTKRKSIRKKRK